MKRHVFLTTDRLDLVLLTANDANDLVTWFNNHQVTEYLARGDYPMSLQFETEYLEKLYQDEAHLQLGLWHRQAEKLIGTTGLHHINKRDQTASFGIMIGESEYWGQGFGTEVLKCMLDWAFDIRNLRTITLSVLSNNPRGQKCYEKCGFVEVGRFEKHVFKKAAWHDEIMMVVRNPRS